MTITQFLSNPWTVAIATGLIVGTILKILFRNNKLQPAPISNKQEQKNYQKTEVTVIATDQKTPRVIFSRDAVALKQEINILFIDDEDLTTKIGNLKQAGWEKVSQIEDAPNLDVIEIREADIIFVDYKGIGKNTREQGLNILSALRQRYPKEKWLILYSAHTVPLDAFNRGADSYLQKNATVYEIEQKILEGAGRIKQ